MLEARRLCSGATGRNEVSILAIREMSVLIDGGPNVLKEVVKTEGLHCEFEVRRSFNISMNEAEDSKDSKRLAESIGNRES